MTVKPLKTYKPPAYPTIAEAKQDARLLERLPRRWGKNKTLATLFGTGLMIHVAGCNKDTPKGDGNLLFPAHAEDAAGQRPAVKKVVRALPATRVAPMLEEALANDGRGGFGCIAISAPVFLSEQEALDLIRAELEKAGLKLQETVSVDGLQIPKGRSFTKGTYAFDLGTEDKSVAVKFLTGKDDRSWGEDTGLRSSYASYNYAALATRVSDAFKQRDKGDPVIIGLFFEPSVYPVDHRDFDMTGLTSEQKQFARNQVEATRKTRHENARELGREKLRRQVSHFVDYLRQEGVVE